MKSEDYPKIANWKQTNSFFRENYVDMLKIPNQIKLFCSIFDKGEYTLNRKSTLPFKNSVSLIAYTCSSQP